MFQEASTSSFQILSNSSAIQSLDAMYSMPRLVLTTCLNKKIPCP
jgi:hypothetical protein